MFKPNNCPYQNCSQHTDAQPGFCIRFGFYRPQCRPRRIQRFRCRACNRTFSRQTFRADYYDHKPHLNAALFSSITDGAGLRQCARKLSLSRRCTELKFRKIARHLRRLNLNLQGMLPPGTSFHFDEIETYEGQRNTRPLSVPVLIESKTRFILWAESAPIRPRGSMTKKRKESIASSEKRHGIRKDLSKRSVYRTLKRGADLISKGEPATLETDEKLSYPAIARKLFGERLTHRKTNSKMVRATFNPLFAINSEETIMRDLMGRLRRESWLVSKKRRYLDMALHVHIAYRNLVRYRFNDERESPAQMLKFLPRMLRPTELLSWRQDWGRRSVHPLSLTGETVETWKNSCAVAA